MKDFKIFLFTCVKDGRQHIGKLFNSLLAQTDTNFIHFIYDNGSIDSIDDLAEEYKNKASKLVKPFEVVYEKTAEPIGLNRATKYCIDRCQQDYFIWIDADNWIDKDFIKFLNRSIIKHPDYILYRTSLVKVEEFDGSISSCFKERKLSLSNANNAAYTFFTRKNHYYYSFFAVNKKLYLMASDNNILDIRDYYNDEQVLSYCYLSNRNFKFVKKSLGFYLARNDSEAHIVLPKNREDRLFFFDTRLDIAKKISDESRNYYLLIEEMFKEYNLIQYYYNKSQYYESRIHFKKLFRLSKNNKFSLNVTFRNKDLFKWFLRLYIKRGFTK